MVDTVKSQLDTTLTLIEDVSETIIRFEEHLNALNTHISSYTVKPETTESTTAISTMASDAAELRNLVISLKQQLDKSFSTDLVPLTATLKYLHQEGIPNLVENASALTVTVQAFQNSIPLLKDSVNSVVANLAPIKSDTEAAGKFARSFQDPMQELLGRDASGKLLEDKFVLRSMARVLFDLTGRDANGVVVKKDRLAAFLDQYFKSNYMNADGSPMSRLSKIGESFLDYAGTHIWQRVFEAILLGLFWLLLVNPASKAVQEVKTVAEKQYQTQMEKPAKK